MDSAMRVAINALTAEIIKVFQIKIPIENIDEVVACIGGRVIENKQLSEDSDGFIRKTENSFEIIVSPYQSKARRNFTVAHELGHLFMHMGYITNRQRWEQQDGVTYFRSGTSEQEYQANEFAGALLMPKDEYINCVNNHTDGTNVNTPEIAKYFHVSVIAASNRGKWLGLLEW